MAATRRRCCALTVLYLRRAWVMRAGFGAGVGFSFSIECSNLVSRTVGWRNFWFQRRHFEFTSLDMNEVSGSNLTKLWATLMDKIPI